MQNNCDVVYDLYVDPKKIQLKPDLKEIYERVMNTPIQPLPHSDTTLVPPASIPASPNNSPAVPHLPTVNTIQNNSGTVTNGHGTAFSKPVLSSPAADSAPASQQELNSILQGLNNFTLPPSPEPPKPNIPTVSTTQPHANIIPGISKTPIDTLTPPLPPAAVPQKQTNSVQSSVTSINNIPPSPTVSALKPPVAPTNKIEQPPAPPVNSSSVTQTPSSGTLHNKEVDHIVETLTGYPKPEDLNPPLPSPTAEKPEMTQGILKEKKVETINPYMTPAREPAADKMSKHYFYKPPVRKVESQHNTGESLKNTINFFTSIIIFFVLVAYTIYWLVYFGVINMSILGL